MFEHEIKFAIKNMKSFLKVLDAQKIELGNEKHQIDKVWILKDADGTNIIPSQPVVRTREQNDKTILTLKREVVHGTMEEHETEIGDIAAAEGMLGALGLRKLVEINKIRKSAKAGIFTLCLDTVKNLGDFLEIEFVTKTKDAEAKTKILEFAKTLGLTEKDITTNTYNTLLCRKFDLR